MKAVAIGTEKEQDLTSISEIKATGLGGRVHSGEERSKLTMTLRVLLGRLNDDALVNDGQEIICREVRGTIKET